MAKNIEYRSSGDIQFRENQGDNLSRHVEGYALKFNVDSVDMGFIETISPEAITQEVIERSDIFALIDHDKDKGVLARSRYGKGTLNLELREDGLFYSFEAPKTQFGDELLSYLQRGEISQSSFGFVIDKDGGDVWERNSDGQLHRTIKKIYCLTDVSPVFQPAYEATTALTRKLDELNSTYEKLDSLEKYFENC